MPNFDAGTSSCSIHGSFTVCGHTDATCPDKKQSNKLEQTLTATEIAINLLISNLEKCGFYPDFQGPEAEKRKKRLMEVAEHLPTLAPAILAKFRELLQNEGIDGGKLSFFVVGGRVNATPIKDNTDFDCVLTSEKRLRPKNGVITLKQRHAVGFALYPEVEKLFEKQGIKHLYVKGIIEFKGFGERAAEDLEKEDGTLKIADLD